MTLVERGADLLDDDLDHLHERCDDQDEAHRLEELQIQRHKHIVLQQIGHQRCDGHHERDGGGHTDGRTHLLGHAQERADKSLEIKR